ncbi:hypothetical protein KBD45_00505 [Candidatus Dojkabacteria bacterium]|nr:hypothetical protein [Candidatus Dojkabacteria bacterium]
MIESKLIEQKKNVKIMITLVFLILLGIGVFFIARTLMNQSDISEKTTSASNAVEKVDYMPGEIIIGFDSVPPISSDTKLIEITQLPDFKLKKRLNETTYLYESITLRDNAFVGIDSGNTIDGKWGIMDQGTNKTLTLLNDKGKKEITGLKYAEPNYKVQTFGN